MKTDTIKPVVNLLGILTIDLPCNREYTDPPVELEDNESSDAQMRSTLVVMNNLPKNAQGNYFCNNVGLFRARYLVTDLAGNTSDTAIRTINCCGFTGLDKATPGDHFNVYPNPGNGMFSITFAALFHEDLHITVADMFGRELLTQFIGQDAYGDVRIDLRGNLPGIYIFKVKTATATWLKRVELH